MAILQQNVEEDGFRMEQIYKLLPSPHPNTLQEWVTYTELTLGTFKKNKWLYHSDITEANYMRYQRGKKLYSAIKKNAPRFSNYLAQSCTITAYSSHFYVFTHLEMVFSDKGFERELKLEKPKYIKTITNSFNEILFSKEINMPWSKLQHRAALACYTIKAIDFSRVVDATIITLLRELSMNEGRFWTDQSHAQRERSLMGYIESIARSRNILEECGILLGQAFDTRTSEWAVAQKIHTFNFHNHVSTKKHPIPWAAKKGVPGIFLSKLTEPELKKTCASWTSVNIQLAKQVARNKGPQHRDITDESFISFLYHPTKKPIHTETFKPITDRKKVPTKGPVTIKPTNSNPPLKIIWKKLSVKQINLNVHNIFPNVININHKNNNLFVENQETMSLVEGLEKTLRKQ